MGSCHTDLQRKRGLGPKDVLTLVSEGVDAFVAGADQFDDLTMLCFKYNGAEEMGQKKA